MHFDDEHFSIIAIGASAGNQDALKEFFSEITDDIQACFVIILHLIRDKQTQMPAIISTFTKLDVVRATHGSRLRPRTVYVMPENVTMTIKDRVLHLEPRDPNTVINSAIDKFFSGLARDFNGTIVAVVLSGMGSDGTEGVKEVYRSGGQVLVQNPDTTQYKGMPLSAIRSDHPDLIGSPKELGRAVLQMVKDIYSTD
jgi:two-component system CheB/CheR fusion protein